LKKRALRIVGLILVGGLTCVLVLWFNLQRRPIPITLADPPPELVGKVTDASGNPLKDVKVRVYTGLATYFPLTDVRTDDRGIFRVPITTGARLLNEAERRWDFSVGIRLEMDTLSSPKGGLHWTGLIFNRPGHVQRIHLRVEHGDVKTSGGGA